MKSVSLVETARRIPSAAALQASADSLVRPGVSARWGAGAGWFKRQRVRPVRRAVAGRLGSIDWGRLVIADALGELEFGKAAGGTPDVRVEVSDLGFWWDLALAGSVGSGEGYVLGRWTCSDLTGLMRLFVHNRSALQQLEGGLARLMAPVMRKAHRMRDNTPEGAARNIADHYDLGNDFYGLFLDETLAYSCAVFEHPGQSLLDASLAKFERICKKLELGPEDHLLEIGSGWGGLAMHAARRFGCRVTSVTISAEQQREADRRIECAGLSGRVEVLQRDYRELTGRYSKLVSVEMIEAVGERHLDEYFRCCSRLLEPDGVMLLQAITIRDQYYEEALRNVDFIQRHIFPGSFIPSLSAMLARVAGQTDLYAAHIEDIGPHYLTTLRHWRERLLARRGEVLAMGFDDSFVRLWEFYLAYCEGGFAERAVGNVQMLLTKPLCRREPLLGSL